MASTNLIFHSTSPQLSAGKIFGRNTVPWRISRCRSTRTPQRACLILRLRMKWTARTRFIPLCQQCSIVLVLLLLSIDRPSSLCDITHLTMHVCSYSHAYVHPTMHMFTPPTSILTPSHTGLCVRRLRTHPWPRERMSILWTSSHRQRHAHHAQRLLFSRELG